MTATGRTATVGEQAARGHKRPALTPMVPGHAASRGTVLTTGAVGTKVLLQPPLSRPPNRCWHRKVTALEARFFCRSLFHRVQNEVFNGLGRCAGSLESKPPVT